MKNCLLWMCFLSTCTAQAQYYYRGRICDVQGKPLPFVRLHVHSKSLFYYTGADGSFGFPLQQPADSVSLFLQGYTDTTVWLQATSFAQLTLHSPAAPPALHRSFIVASKHINIPHKAADVAGGETYRQTVENDFLHTIQHATVGFAMHADKASYPNIRRFIRMGMKVPQDAVRIEEILNYFNQSYTKPPVGKTFYHEWQLTDCPWNNAHKLMLIRLHAQKVNYEELPPNNLVFLIDVSGSMELPNRLDLLKTAFRMLVEHLRAKDTISIVVYGGGVGVRLYPTAGSEKARIMQVIDSLEAAGDTPGEAALRTAYSLAEKHYLREGNNRIILATDGDFNVGEVSESALAQLVMLKQRSGIYLTCLGVGMGNYKDSRLELLARYGKGNFAYLDRIEEAERVLVTELTQTLFTVADDAVAQVHFNPAYIKKFRLIGYDNDIAALNADTSLLLKGGEIGSGHIVTALFEIEPTENVLPLSDTLATVEVNFRHPADGLVKHERFICFNNYMPFAQALPVYRFSVGVAMMGMLLRNSSFLGQNYWPRVKEIIDQSADESKILQQQLKTLMPSILSLYAPPSKKRLKKRRH